jgi:hypothetical protein
MSDYQQYNYPPTPPPYVLVAEHGTVTLLETAYGWSIIGTAWPSARVYRFTAKRCLCVEHAEAIYDDKCRQGNYAASFAARPAPLCIEPPGHTGDHRHRREHDHCWSMGHYIKVRALFEHVAKSYDSTHKPFSTTRALNAIAPARRITASKEERARYARWLADNDPDATNPYAVTQ